MVCMGVCGPTVPLRGVSKFSDLPHVTYPSVPGIGRALVAHTSHQRTWPQFSILLTNSTG